MARRYVPTQVVEEQGLLFDAQVVTPVGKDALRLVAAASHDCRRCPRHAHRRVLLRGEGNAEKPLLAFVGNGPTETDEKEGKLLTGRPGAMFNRMLSGLNLKREDVFLTGSVYCKGQFWFASKEELTECREFVQSELLAVRPRVIVSLGHMALLTLVGGEGNALASRGRWSEFCGIPVMPTLHPDQLMQPDMEKLKPLVWEDILRAYDRAVALAKVEAYEKST